MTVLAQLRSSSLNTDLFALVWLRLLLVHVNNDEREKIVPLNCVVWLKPRLSDVAKNNNFEGIVELQLFVQGMVMNDYFVILLIFKKCLITDDAPKYIATKSESIFTK